MVRISQGLAATLDISENALRLDRPDELLSCRQPLLSRVTSELPVIRQNAQVRPNHEWRSIVLKRGVVLN